MDTVSLKSVVIGSSFAKLLGYEELVGQMGFIAKERQALCSVTVLTGPAHLIGQEYDIHRNDLELQANEEDNKYFIILNVRDNVGLYTADREFGQFVLKVIGLRHCKHYPGCTSTQLVDYIDRHMERHCNEKEEKEWRIMNLDKDQTDVVSYYRELFKAEKEKASHA